MCGDKLQHISIPAMVTIEKFEEEKDQFDLFDKFSVTFDDASSLVCVLQEEELIKMLYHYPTMYEALGREFCIIFVGSRPRAYGQRLTTMLLCWLYV